MRTPFLSERQGKFAREVGGVVLGVLIALGIGEAADLVRWKMRVADTMTTLRTELAGNRWNVVERQNYQPCLERRIALLGDILAVLLQAWSNAKLEGHMIGLAASQIDQGMKDFDIPAGEGDDEWNAEKLKAKLPEYKLCKPITVAGKVQA